MSDKYTQYLLSLLPSGNIAKDAASNNALIFGLIAAELSRIDGRAADLMTEADPRTTVELFEEWEAFAGLPDPCALPDQTLQERRNRLEQKLVSKGGQTRAYYEEIAAHLGYDITITEFRPFECGISECIDVDPELHISITHPEDRFIWRVNVHGDRATWFRCGESECGVDPMLKLTRATDLECIFNQQKQAHTQVQFLYEEA